MPRSVLLACALLTAGAGALPAQAGGSSIRGTISAPDGRPIPGARVVRFGTSDTVRADSAGRYLVEHVALGRHIFVVRQPGFQSIEMEVTLNNDTNLTVDVPLETAQAVASGKLARVGFEERRRQAAGRHDEATFLGPEEIANRAASRTVELLEGVPDITMRNEGQIPVVYGFDRRCIMVVWLDGQRVDNVFPAMTTTSATRQQTRGSAVRSSTFTGLDELIRPNAIAAIEIYPRPTRVPTQFQVSTAQNLVATGRSYETRSSECGAIVIWSTLEN